MSSRRVVPKVKVARGKPKLPGYRYFRVYGHFTSEQAAWFLERFGGMCVESLTSCSKGMPDERQDSEWILIAHELVEGSVDKTKLHILELVKKQFKL